MVQLAPLRLLQVEHLGLARECSRATRDPIKEPAPGIKNGPAATGRIEMDPIHTPAPENSPENTRTFGSRTRGGGGRNRRGNQEADSGEQGGIFRRRGAASAGEMDGS